MTTTTITAIKPTTTGMTTSKRLHENGEENCPSPRIEPERPDW